MYTFRCGTLIQEFGSSQSAMRGIVRHRVRWYTGRPCQEEHTIYHNDDHLGQTAELPFIDLGFLPEYVIGLTRRGVRNDSVLVPGQFFAVTRKYKDHPSLQRYANASVD